MPTQSVINLATHTSKADTPGKPDAATHVLMFWPPAWDSLAEMLRKQIARSGQWSIYTVHEYETGDYCQGDRWTLEASRRKSVADLTTWTSGELGQPVTLQYAGETEYGPVYWVLPNEVR
jgi:hypothetical protein